MSEQTKPVGDWYCKCCGCYLSASRVNPDETCDTCGRYVEWHSTDVSDTITVEECRSASVDAETHSGDLIARDFLRAAHTIATLTEELEAATPTTQDDVDISEGMEVFFWDSSLGGVYKIKVRAWNNTEVLGDGEHGEEWTILQAASYSTREAALAARGESG